mmetsp:Transcript_42216/g.84614  ORF Transcript_42216/g.84614 Transcript_42216/m.84614 type:complete len:213 (+) Transcript_42216:345-983(+)
MELVDGGEPRRRGSSLHPRRRPLRHAGRQGPHPGVYCGGEAQGDGAGQDHLLPRAAGRREDLHRQEHRLLPEPKVLPLFGRRHDGRLRDQGPPSDLRGSHARQAHPGAQVRREQQPCDRAGRDRQARTRVPGRSGVRAAGGFGPVAEPRVPRPLPRRPGRPLPGALHLHSERAGHDPGAAQGPDGGDHSVRVHRRGQGPHRGAPPVTDGQKR